MPKTKAYIPYHRMLQAQADAIRDRLKGCSEESINLYVHILESNIRQSHQYEDGSPIPSVAIKKYRRGAHISELLPFLEGVRSHKPGRCRRFKIKDELIAEHLAIADRMSAEEYDAHPKVVFETKEMRRKARQPRLNNASRHPEPPLIRAAIKVLTHNGCYADEQAIKEVVRQRRTIFDEVLPLYEEAKCLYKEAEQQLAPESREFKEIKKNYLEVSEPFYEASGRYYNDSSCRSAILSYPLIEKDGDIRHFIPAWTSQSTGRIHPLGGGLQSASKEMKQAAYARIDGIKNYDLESSQPVIAISLMQHAGIDPDWLVRYIETPNYKEVYGRAAGVSGGLFKRVVIALLMGGQLPRSLQQARFGEFELAKHIGKEAKDIAHFTVMLRGLWDVVGDLIEALDMWHEYLRDVYIPKNKIQGGYLRNAIGKCLSISALDLRNKNSSGVRQIAAFLLQGMEAAVILETIARSEEAGFKPISCEHDGFIVSAGAPDMAMFEEITQRHGLERLRLVEKAIL